MIRYVTELQAYIFFAKGIELKNGSSASLKYSIHHSLLVS
jgi:hypothetical protein